jgi:hypothetical protein
MALFDGLSRPPALSTRAKLDCVSYAIRPRHFSYFLFHSVPALAINPPLRGYDETSHFLRAFSIIRGDVVPHM